MLLTDDPLQLLDDTLQLSYGLGLRVGSDLVHVGPRAHHLLLEELFPTSAQKYSFSPPGLQDR